MGIQGLPNFGDTLIISGTGKATDFKFCTHIHRSISTKAHDFLGKLAVGIVRAPMGRIARSSL